MLRAYQKDCIETTLREFENGCNKQIVSLPVGSGKTVIMSNLIPKIPSPTPKATKVLLLAHRTELLDQAYHQITKYNPDLAVQIEQGKRNADIDSADVVIASVPTLGRKPSAKSIKGTTRLDRLQPDQFKAILIDEAHHAVAETYTRILEHFGVFNSKPPALTATTTSTNGSGTAKKHRILLWGCTATAKRHDGIALRSVFDKITFHVDFMDMIEQGYLCPMRVTTVDTKVDLGHVKLSSSSGDFVGKDLAVAVNTKTRNQVIVSSWQKYGQQGLFDDNNKSTADVNIELAATKVKKEEDTNTSLNAKSIQRQSTLAFAVDIEHTMQLCNDFIAAGINAKCITSKTNAVDRIKILNEFRERKLPVLVNCGILTEGTDIPCVDCILLARPTRSTTLFQQMFGRGLRLFPGKKDCLVIDFVDNFKRTGKAGIITVPTLLGLDSSTMVTDKDILELEKEALSKKDEKKAIKENEDKTKDLTLEAPVVTDADDNDPDRIKVCITEYHSIQELIADFSVPKHIRAASNFGWVNIGQNKCVLYVLKKGFLVLNYDADSQLWKGSFRYKAKNTNILWKSFDLPLEASDLPSAVRAADTWVVKKFGNSVNPLLLSRNAPYRFDKATPAQLSALERYKMLPIETDGLTKGQLMDLLTKLKFGQMKLWKQQLKDKMKEKKTDEQRRKSAVLTRNKSPVP